MHRGRLGLRLLPDRGCDLTAAVLTRFFEENFSDELCAVRPGERFTFLRAAICEAPCAARTDMSV